MKKKVEILAPAGSYESLKAAISAGADAVYIGGSRFGARAFANNLNEDELLEAIDYVHIHGKKIYLTVNTLLKEEEIKGELYDYLLPYYRQGLDAVIVQDIGVLKFVKEHFPKLPIHASTQMTVTNVSGAKFLESLGVERVVTAREMSLVEIEEIGKETGVEIESFVHGALCYCYSGQCLYSSLIGGRSGNRGQCAQPCRLPYKIDGKTSYVMSLKDMCALSLIPKLIEAGIYSFKIEGRMKKPEYVAGVVSIYRKYVDLYLEKGKAGFCVEEKDMEILMDLYNRGGFHSGYYKTRNGKEMLSLKRPNHAGVPAVKVISQQKKEVCVQALVDLHKGDILELPGQENYTTGREVLKGEKTTLIAKSKEPLSKGMILSRTRNEELLNRLRSDVVERKVKEKINGKLILSVNKRAKLELSGLGAEISLEGEPVQEALNQPMEHERIEKQMRKTGNTEVEFQNLEIQTEGSVFVPMQSLNELRRQGIEKLEEKALLNYRREEPENVRDKEHPVQPEEEKKKQSGFCVYVEQNEQFDAALSFESVRRIYIDCMIVESAWENEALYGFIERAHEKQKEIYFAMPYIFRKETKNLYERFFDTFAFDGILVRNLETYEFLMEKAPSVKVILDANMYHFNREAKQFWKDRGITEFTAPVELNQKELKALDCKDGEIIIYGYLQMMVSAQCVRKTMGKCTKKTGFLTMTDRMNKDFTVKNCCDYCYNVIYNTEPLSLLDQKKELEAIKAGSLRLHFTLETKEETRDILNCFEDVFVKEKEAEFPLDSFTRGHFKRGIK